LINKDTANFWNRGYVQGQDYRQLADKELDNILKNISNKETALDMGCGTGHLARQLARRSLAVTGVDISDEAIKLAKQQDQTGVIYRRMNIENEDLRELGKFDVVFCKLVIAFLKDKTKFISEIPQLLTPHGAFILITPVVDDPQNANAHISAISVNEDELKRTVKANFRKIESIKKKLSPAHSWLTLIASP